jgi:hypothetical protein
MRVYKRGLPVHEQLLLLSGHAQQFLTIQFDKFPNISLGIHPGDRIRSSVSDIHIACRIDGYSVRSFKAFREN